MGELKKKIIRGNNGYSAECWIGLEKGDKLLCLKTERGLLDVGMSGMTMPFDSLVKGKEYTVDSISNSWNVNGVAYVLDEDNCCTWATTELFEPITRITSLKQLSE